MSARRLRSSSSRRSSRTRRGRASRCASTSSRAGSRRGTTSRCSATSGRRPAARSRSCGAELGVEVVARAAPSRACEARRAGRCRGRRRARTSCRERALARTMQRAIDRLCAASAVRRDPARVEPAVRVPLPDGARAGPRRAQPRVRGLRAPGRGRAVAAAPAVPPRSSTARFRRFEQGWWRRVDGCVVTSPREEQIVRRARAATRRSRSCRTASTSTTSGPTGSRARPDTVVFNGLLDYRPNLDAAPLAGRRDLAARPAPPPGRPAGDRRARRRGRSASACARPGVEVTGEVPDVRPYLDARRGRRRPDPHGRRHAPEGRRGPGDGQGRWSRPRSAARAWTCATASTCSWPTRAEAFAARVVASCSRIPRPRPRARACRPRVHGGGVLVEIAGAGSAPRTRACSADRPDIARVERRGAS